MALIQFVRNYDDLSTDRGDQFKFYCDHCGNGHMSEFETSLAGTAGSVLRVASDLFGGWFTSAGNSSYEIQRAVGGSAHDKALKNAVEQARTRFRQCSRCGKWVCPDVCWNHTSGQCEDCAPNFSEEVAAAHAQARAAAVREQLHTKASATDYVSGIDMRAAVVQTPEAPTTVCSCGEAVSGKFCSGCGQPARQPQAHCRGCGTTLKASVKFCPECGTRTA
ncbi:MAG TPA: hypothetical protein VES20_08485 [Bryobacteraceae bacterium]|nr:hypothetical protein [Bryobacteraceae bacterium]